MERENDVLELGKSSKTGLVLLFLVIMLLVGGGLYYYFAYFNNPTYIITQGIKRFSKVNESEKNIVSFDKPLRVRSSIEFDLKNNDAEMQKFYDIFNDLDLLFNVDFDTKNKLVSSSISSKYQDNKLINAKLYQEGNNSYIFLEDLYDKYIAFDKLEETQENFTSKYNMEDIEIILNDLEDVFTKAFLEEDFHREKETIKHNDKELEVYKNYIFYNKDNYKKVNERIVKSIKENTDLFNALNKVLGKDKIKEILDTLSNMKELKDFSMEFIIYTKGYNNEFVKMVLKLDNKDDYMIIETDSTDAMTISMITSEMDVKFTMEENEQNSFVYSFNIVDEEIGNVYIKINAIVENIKDVEKINVEKAVKYDELTEEDFTKIMDKLDKNEAINKIVNNLSGIFKEDFTFSM